MVQRHFSAVGLHTVGAFLPTDQHPFIREDAQRVDDHLLQQQQLAGQSTWAQLVGHQVDNPDLCFGRHAWSAPRHASRHTVARLTGSQRFRQVTRRWGLRVHLKNL